MSPAVRKYLAEIGRKGGQAKSPAKSKAARQNARKRWARVRAQKRAEKAIQSPQSASMPPVSTPGHSGKLAKPRFREIVFDNAGRRKRMPAKAEPQIGRNERCPCQSGRKFKHCCGKST